MKPVFIHYVMHSKKYIVSTVKFYGWTAADTTWMNDDKLGSNPLIPNIDIIDEQWEFDDEETAMVKVAQLYKTQLDELALYYKQFNELEPK